MYERTEGGSSNNEEYGSAQTYCGPATMMAEMARYFPSQRKSDTKNSLIQTQPAIEVSAGFTTNPDPFSLSLPNQV
jgi:hypothetical protein